MYDLLALWIWKKKGFEGIPRSSDDLISHRRRNAGSMEHQSSVRKKARYIGPRIFEAREHIIPLSHVNSRGLLEFVYIPLGSVIAGLFEHQARPKKPCFSGDQTPELPNAGSV